MSVQTEQTYYEWHSSNSSPLFLFFFSLYFILFLEIKLSKCPSLFKDGKGVILLIFLTGHATASKRLHNCLWSVSAILLYYFSIYVSVIYHLFLIGFGLCNLRSSHPILDIYDTLNNVVYVILVQRKNNNNKDGSVKTRMILIITTAHIHTHNV